jgi:hypothetical protein
MIPYCTLSSSVLSVATGFLTLFMREYVEMVISFSSLIIQYNVASKGNVLFTTHLQMIFVTL